MKSIDFLDDSKLSLIIYSLIFRTSVSFLSAQLGHKVLVQKGSGDLVSKRRLEIEISFRVISPTNVLFRFRRNKYVRRIAPLANDVIPFLTRNRNEKSEYPQQTKPVVSNLVLVIAVVGLRKPDKSTSRDFVACSFASRPKNHASLAKTFSPGILVRSTCGKSMKWEASQAPSTRRRL